MRTTPSGRISPTLCLLTLAALTLGSSVPKPPETPKRPVIDEYQGVAVADAYRWLENGDDPEVKQWTAAQNSRTRAYLDHLAVRPPIKEGLKKRIAGRSASYSDLRLRGGTLFALKYQPPQQQPTLVALRSADDAASAKIIFDPNAASARGSLAVDFYVPSPDGTLVAAALSENGSEDSSAHIFEVATGKELSDVVPRVNFATAGGSLEWKGDGSGFYYTRYPQGDERPPEDVHFYQQVYFHRVGTDPRQDTYVIGKDFPRIAEIQLRGSDDGLWLVAAVAHGDGGQFAHYVMDAGAHWTQVTHLEDGIVSAKLGPDAALYLLSRKDAPRGRILRLPLSHLDLADARVVVPQSPGSGADEAARASIEDFVPAPGHLYVVDVLGGPSRLRVFDLEGHPLPGPALPPVSAVGETVPQRDGNLLFQVSSYLQPPAWYRFDAMSGKAAASALVETSPVRFDDAEVVRELATSSDGTRIPLNVIRRKGTTLDGRNPTLLQGYGGFGISMKPFFLGPFGRAWLDQGGVEVVANLRVGAEYG
jgi:prolyl oligopeptidase